MVLARVANTFCLCLIFIINLIFNYIQLLSRQQQLTHRQQQQRQNQRQLLQLERQQLYNSPVQSLCVL